MWLIHRHQKLKTLQSKQGKKSNVVIAEAPLSIGPIDDTVTDNKHMNAEVTEMCDNETDDKT